MSTLKVILIVFVMVFIAILFQVFGSGSVVGNSGIRRYQDTTNNTYYNGVPEN